MNNELRTNPQKFISYLEEEITHFEPDGTTLVRKLPDGRNMNVRTQEGISAWKEALADLKKREPMPPLKWTDAGMRSCTDHVNDLGPSGNTGHKGSDDSMPGVRISRYAEWSSYAENLTYQRSLDETRIIMGLFIDDGVPDRGHRHALFMDIESAGVRSGDLNNPRMKKIACINYITMKGGTFQKN